MVAMVVRDEQVIDLLDLGRFGSLDDPVRVAPLESPPARIDQQRLPGRTDDQRGLPALHVNEEDLERPGDCAVERETPRQELTEARIQCPARADGSHLSIASYHSASGCTLPEHRLKS